MWACLSPGLMKLGEEIKVTQNEQRRRTANYEFWEGGGYERAFRGEGGGESLLIRLPCAPLVPSSSSS